MAWRGNYQSRFVSASSSSSSTSNVPSDPSRRFPSMSGSMNSVPPPAQLTLPNAAGAAFSNIRPPPSGIPPMGTLPPPGLALHPAVVARQEQRRKEEEYSALISGEKKAAAERRKRLYDDEYLEPDSDDEEDGRRRRNDEDDRRNSSRNSESSRGSSSSKREKAKKEGSDDEDDPLEAFMAGINQQAKSEKEESLRKDLDRRAGKETEADGKDKLGRTDIDEEDMQESYFNFLEEKKANAANDDEDIYEYDEDGNIIWTWKKVIDPLPVLDHSTVKYAPFHKNFYVEHDDIKNLNHLEVVKLREKLGIKAGGFGVPKPVASFAHFGFDEALMKEIRKLEYEHPTPIQAQAIPAALSGRDVLGIAKTGSGKTAAYLWPVIMHIMDQKDLEEGDGPIALVVVPTRELAIQVYQEARRFCRAYNINVICAYGGGSKWEQSNELQGEGAELVVCTPGRIIDLVKIKTTNFTRVTYLVFDEADRMFDMGFEAQVRSISDHIRPDRQCLMFSATFKNKVERLARDALHDPIRIVQGEVGEANADIAQCVYVLPSQDAKFNWLSQRLVQYISTGKVLVFVTKKMNADDIANRLRRRDFKLVLLHGDMQQHERNEQLSTFRGKGCDLMVATDVAARGLDIPEIRTVVNYDIARDIDTHVHRIGRTGRAGEKGWAYTLMTEADKEMAGHYVRNLESVNQEVPQQLMTLAMKAQWFRAERKSDGSSAAPPRARFGLGYQPKTRPGAGPGAKKAGHDPLTANLSRPSASSSLGPMATALGPGASSKLSVLKNAFKNQFSSNFHRSSEQSELPPTHASDPRPEWKRKLDELNAKLQASQGQSSTGNSSKSDGVQKKKSRWES